MIAGYLDHLAGALSFDRALSQSVRHEVEDHLREAVATDSMGAGPEAERRAIARFGDPHVLAAEFALASVTRQAKGIGGGLVLVVAAVLIAMKARVAWYVAAQWTISDDMKAISSVVLLIDRYAFWSSVLLGIAAFMYINGRGAARFSTPISHKQLRRFVCLSFAATVALCVAVISDGLLTGFQVYGATLSLGSLVPIFLMAAEIACASVLVFYIRCIARRSTGAAALLNA